MRPFWWVFLVACSASSTPLPTDVDLTKPTMMTKYLPTPDRVLATSCGYPHAEFLNGYLSA